MRRLLLAASCVLLLWSFAQAQMRGRVGAPAGRSGFGVRGSFVANRGFGFGGHWRSGVVIRTFPRPFFRNRFYRRFPYYPAWYGYTPYAYYGGYYGSFYPGWGAYSIPHDSSENNQEIQQLYSEVNRLSNEVESLREQQEAGAYAPQPPSPPAPTVAPEPPRNAPPPEPSTLIFRDGHREQIMNYAIVGDTLWILDEQHARKVPLSDIANWDK